MSERTSDPSRMVLDAVPVGVWVTERDGRIVDVNPTGCAMLGFTRDEVVGRSILELSHPEDVASRAPLLDAKPGEVVVTRRRLMQRGGGWALVEGHARILDDGRIVTAVHDVTELARAERALAESEREFRGIFQLAASGKSSVDPATGRYLRVNRKFCEITGYSEEELLARTFVDLTHPDDRARDLEAFQRAVRGETAGWTSEKRYVRKDGTERWVVVAGTLLRDDDGRPLRTVQTILDIDERKRMEAALRDADRRKDEFLAMLSHELRNPLAPMRNALAVLAASAPDGQRARRARATLERQVLHLSRLVDDLLDLTRVSRGKVHLRKEPIDLAQVAARAADDHRSLLSGAGVALDVRIPAEPVIVDGDATRLAQVLGNLLQNAAKFTPEGGLVRVELRRGADGGAVLTVKDDGVGMTPAVLETLFEPFSQGETTIDRSRGGLGLGLALVKRLVQLHGGTVTARSDGPGRGAEFVIALPPGRMTQPHAAAARASHAGRSGRRVLVVDDNVDAGDTLRDLLELRGHETAIARDGHEALATARAFVPDVVLCDIGLPGMDGYAVARALRADQAVSGALLVALTGYALPEDLRRAEEAGFDAHLAKPPPLEKLEKLLERAAPRIGGAGHGASAGFHV